MILEQYYLACLSHASYLVADERTRTAAVVDPQRDVDQYVEDAKRRGLTIRHVLLRAFSTKGWRLTIPAATCGARIFASSSVRSNLVAAVPPRPTDMPSH